jgi:hypothetical protein
VIDTKKQDAFLVRAAFFLVAGATMLLAVLFSCQYWYPKALPGQPSMGRGMAGLQAEKTWWERLLDKFKVPPINRRLQREKKARTGQVSQGRRLSSTVTSREQMLLRQKILAELQLVDCEGRSSMTALERVQLPRGPYPWKAYEVNRMRTAILAESFEESYSVRWLKPLLESANKTASSDFANFEDFFWAGRANLFAGDLRQARNYLHIGKRRWPVKSGLLYGMTELMLAMTDALIGDSEKMLLRMESLRVVFPDWFYSEIYQADFEYLERKYPNEPLIFMLHGRLLSMGFNDAEAMKLYQKAMAMPKLHGPAKVRLQQWIQTLKKVHGL